MHNDRFDLYLIGIVARRVLDSKSVSLAIYLSTVVKVCLGKHRAVKSNDSIIIDTHLL